MLVRRKNMLENFLNNYPPFQLSKKIFSNKEINPKAPQEERAEGAKPDNAEGPLPGQDK